MEEMELLYGADAQGIKTGQQVSFAITSESKKGTKGTVGSGAIEFNEATHTIYVNGVKYGTVDASGAEISVADLEKQISDVESAAAQNVTNLKIFKKIGGIEADSNSAELKFATDETSAVKIVSAGDTVTFGVGAASDTSIGGIKSGDDLTVDATGDVTVNHAINADKVDITAASASGSILVGTVGENATVYATDTISFVKDDSSSAVRYTGSYLHADDIATKGDVDSEVTALEKKISDITGAAVDGMHFRGGAESLPQDASTGDLYVASKDFEDKVGGKTVESGDYLIKTSDGWVVINRNITETTEITDATEQSALIPTVGAVTKYVDDAVEDLEEKVDGIKFISTVTGDTGSFEADSASDSIKFAGDTYISTTANENGVTFAHKTVTVGNTDTSVKFTQEGATPTLETTFISGVTTDGAGHVTGLTKTKFVLSELVDEINDSINDASTLAEAGAHTVDQNAMQSTDASVYLLGGAGGDKKETSYAAGATLNGKGELAVTGLTVNGVKIDSTKSVQDAEAIESETPSATIENGKLTVGGVAAIPVDGIASTTNTYNASVLAQSIFWTVE